MHDVGVFNTTDAIELEATRDEKPNRTEFARLKFDGSRLIICTDKNEYAVVLVELETAKDGKPNLADLLTGMEV